MGSENSNEKAREIRAHLRAEEREDGETDRSERGKDQRRDERPAISIETYRNRTVEEDSEPRAVGFMVKVGIRPVAYHCDISLRLLEMLRVGRYNALAAGARFEKAEVSDVANVAESAGFY